MIYIITKVLACKTGDDIKTVMGYTNTKEETREFLDKNPLSPQKLEYYRVDEIQPALDKSDKSEN